MLNGNVQIPESMEIIGENAFKECINLNVELELQNQHHTDYNFDGWYTDTEYINRFTGNAQNQNDTIYAHWTPIKVTITFNENGGDSLTQEQKQIKVDYKTTINNLPECTRKDYKFEGWFTKEDEGDLVTAEYLFKEDMELYAHWTYIEPEPEVEQNDKGDVNNDGKVNARDAKLVLQSYTGKVELDETQKLVADVNRDEKVNARDAKLILQYYTGKIKNF